MLICFTKNNTYEGIKNYIDNLDKKQRREILGKGQTHQIIVYYKDYIKSPIIFDGNEIEAKKYWGNGKKITYTTN